MKIKSLAILAVCSLFAVGCGSSNKNDGTAPHAIQQTDTGPGDVTHPVVAPSGAQVASSKVASVTISDKANAAATEADMTKLLTDYADIGRDVAVLKSIDKVVETDSKGVDLYAGAVLVATLSADASGVWTVTKSNATFMPASIVAGMSATDPKQATMNSLTFAFHQCISTPGQQDQKGKETAAKETCADVNAIVILQREQQKQEQKQDQKGQEQGKNPSPQPLPKP